MYRSIILIARMELAAQLYCVQRTTRAETLPNNNAAVHASRTALSWLRNSGFGSTGVTPLNEYATNLKTCNTQ